MVRVVFDQLFRKTNLWADHLCMTGNDEGEYLLYSIYKRVSKCLGRSGLGRPRKGDFFDKDTNTRLGLILKISLRQLLYESQEINSSLSM